MDYLIIQMAKNRVNVGRFKISGRSSSLAGSASFVLGGELDLASVLSRIAEGITGSPRVVLCLSPELFAQRMVDLPLTDLRKAREVLPGYLQGEMTLSGEEVVFELVQSSEGRFIAIWAKKTDLVQAISIFSEAGLEPAVISSAPFAWQALPGITEDCAVTDGSALALFAGGKPAFIRALSHEQSGREPGVTLAALEMSGVSLPSRLYVFDRLAEELPASAGTSITAEPLKMPENLAPIFRSDEVFSRTAGLYAVARACHSGALPDFRRGDLAWKTGDARLRKKLLLTAFLAAAAMLLLFGYKGWQYRQASADLASLNKSIFNIYREIFPGRAKAVDELAEVKGEIRRLGGGENSVAVLVLLRKLAEAKGTTINGLYEVDLEGRTLTIKGDAASAQLANDFKTALLPLMAAIEMVEVKSRPDRGVSFMITGTLKEGQL